MSKKIVITGGNRGIGLALVENFLRQGEHVISSARKRDEAKALKALSDEFPDHLNILELEVANPDSLKAFSEEVSKLGQIDILLNNAGIMQNDSPSVSELSLAEIEKHLQVNLLGPIRVTKRLWPLLNPKQAVVAQMTSQMGSIADNSSGGFYGYRISKAALNMFHKSLSFESESVICLTLHPGWVQTDMGGPNAKITTEESAEGLAQILSSATSKQNGKFLNYRGEELPW